MTTRIFVPRDAAARAVGADRVATAIAQEAKRNGAHLLTLQPSEPVTATVRLHVFKPSGPVRGIAADGRALLHA